MIQIHHLNCVEIQSPMGVRAIGHCLLIESVDKLILIDTGVGFLDVQNANERIGDHLITEIGYQLKENQTAIRQIEALGLLPENVTDCIISHLDNDHIGGLADFPTAVVHVGTEEYDNYLSGNPRYLRSPLAHQPNIKQYKHSNKYWFGFEARKVEIDITTDIFLIPLFGHTFGHCGVALKIEDKWLFYVRDAYYIKEELTDCNHPVSTLSKLRADDDTTRIETLKKIRNLLSSHPEIEIFSYHDPNELSDERSPSLEKL